MEHVENQEVGSSMPVIPRLDRLDLLLQLLEEKHSLSRRGFSGNNSYCVITEKDECKTLSSALEEVNHKGTLMERLTMLENRVVQLSLEMEEGNTSKSSSSTIQVSETLGRNTIILPQTQPPPKPAQAKEEVSTKVIARKEAKQSHEQHDKKSPKKWRRLFAIRLTC